MSEPIMEWRHWFTDFLDIAKAKVKGDVTINEYGVTLHIHYPLWTAFYSMDIIRQAWEHGVTPYMAFDMWRQHIESEWAKLLWKGSSDGNAN